MTIPVVGATIGVFHDHASAEQAIAELRKAGFANDLLGVLGRESGSVKIAVGDSKRVSVSKVGGKSASMEVARQQGGEFQHITATEDRSMARRTFAQVELNQAQQAEAELIFQRIQGAFLDEARRLSQLMASKGGTCLAKRSTRSAIECMAWAPRCG